MCVTTELLIRLSVGQLKEQQQPKQPDEKKEENNKLLFSVLPSQK